MFRWPVRFMIVFQLSAAILTAFGVSYLQECFKQNIFLTNKITKFITIFASILIFSALLIIIFKTNILTITQNKLLTLIQNQGGIKYNSIEFYQTGIIKIFNTIFKSLFKLAVLTGILMVILKKIKNVNLKIYAIVILLIIEVSVFHYKFLRLTDCNNVILPAEILKKLDNNYRICSLTDLFPPNINARFNLKSISGYEPLIPKRYDYYIRRIEQNKKIPENIVAINPDIKNRMFDLLSVKYIFTEDSFDTLPKLTKIFEMRNNKFKIYENKNAAPMIYLTKKIIQCDTNQMFAIISSDTYNFEDCVYTQDDLSKLSNNQTLLKSDEIQQFPKKLEIKKTILKNDYAKIEYSADTECFCVFQTNANKNWKVYINGQITSKNWKIVNYIFMAISVPAGNNNIIEWKYE